jgi:hypothetical protein
VSGAIVTAFMVVTVVPAFLVAAVLGAQLLVILQRDG